MSNKRDLKAYVRYDGSGRIVPSGIILSRVKPKVGNWKETPAYMCQGMTIYVCNAGTEAVNGRYLYKGIRNGKYYYEKGTYVISWGEYPGMDDWEIYDSTIANNWFYYSEQDVNTPDLVSEGWHSDDGVYPAPSVGRCPCSEINSPPSILYICIAGFMVDIGWNGVYTYIGEAEGKPHYQKDGNRDVYWHSGQWWIGDVAYSNDDVTDPTLVSTWEGIAEPITVIEGTCTFPEDCHTVTLTCTDGDVAVFGVYYCYEEPAVLMVSYGSPQEVCCYDYPVLLNGSGTMELGDSCVTTTTTTTATPTTTTTTTLEG